MGFVGLIRIGRFMRIGELSRRVGVSVQTVRFYERCGLLKTPTRTPSGYRIFSEDDVELVQLIRKAKHFGFKLKEIRRLVLLCPLAEKGTGQPLLARCAPRCLDEIRRMCEAKLAEFDQQVESLAALRRELAGTVRQLFPAQHTRGSQPVSRKKTQTPFSSPAPFSC